MRIFSASNDNKNVSHIACLYLSTEGQTLPLNRRQKVFPNGTLIVEQTQRGEDAGTYTCQATNRQRHVARRDVEVQILGTVKTY